MHNKKIEFMNTVGDTKMTCNECEALLVMLKAFCEEYEPESDLIYYVFVLVDILINKNSELNKQLNCVETFSQYL